MNSKRDEDQMSTLQALAARLTRRARQWAAPLHLVQADDLMALAQEVGATPGGDPDEPPTIYWDRPGVIAYGIDRVRFKGILAAHWATAWAVRDSVATAGSPVFWDTKRIFPWVVEVHIRTPSLTDDGYGLTAFTMPCRVDPRTPSAEGDAAIKLCTLRAMMHEAQEGLILDDVQVMDPHNQGEYGLLRLAQRVGAWAPGKVDLTHIEGVTGPDRGD